MQYDNRCLSIQVCNYKLDNLLNDLETKRKTNKRNRNTETPLRIHYMLCHVNDMTTNAINWYAVLHTINKATYDIYVPRDDSYL